MTEKIIIVCSECSAKLRVAADIVARKVKCPKCGEAFLARPAVAPVSNRATKPPVTASRSAAGGSAARVVAAKANPVVGQKPRSETSRPPSSTEQGRRLGIATGIVAVCTLAGVVALFSWNRIEDSDSTNTDAVGMMPRAEGGLNAVVTTPTANGTPDESESDSNSDSEDRALSVTFGEKSSEDVPESAKPTSSILHVADNTNDAARDAGVRNEAVEPPTRSLAPSATEQIALSSKFDPVRTPIPTSLRTSSKNWPRFRGIDGHGFSDVTGLSTTWDDTTNIRWKLLLPGPGLSSPIVWGDHIYVTCFTGYDWPVEDKERRLTGNLERHLICVDANSGRVKWRRTDPADHYRRDLDFPTVHLRYHGYASNTPACDDNAVYAWFGADGLFAFTHDGEPLWQTSCGTGHNQEGSGGSPIVDNGQIFVPAWIESNRLYAVDAATGEKQWDLRGVGSYGTPTVQIHDGRRKVLIRKSKDMVAVDAESGELLWSTEGDGIGETSASILVSGDRIIATHSWDVDLRVHSENGDVLWEVTNGPELGTPLLVGDRIFFAKNNVFTVVNFADGAQFKRGRLPASKYYASPVYADGKVFCVSRSDGVVVLDAEDFEVLAHNKLTDEFPFEATPAITRQGLILRSSKTLYCIGKQENTNSH